MKTTKIESHGKIQGIKRNWGRIWNSGWFWRDMC